MSELDEERERLLGVLQSRGTEELLFKKFPVIRRYWPKPHEMSLEQALAYMKGPIRQRIDYTSVGRKTLILYSLPEKK